MQDSQVKKLYGDQPAPPKPAPLPKPRITVVEQVYFHSVQRGVQDSPAGSKFSFNIDTDEQPYGARQMRVDNKWLPFDTGWLQDKVSILYLTNEPARRTTVPTATEYAAETNKVVQVGVLVPELNIVVPLFWLHVGQGMRLHPVDIALLRVRCAPGESATLLVTAFPK